MNGKVTRRAMLRVLGVTPVVSLAACRSEGTATSPHPSGTFFSDEERRALSALADVVIPPEPGSPGGGDLGATAYIERLLTAFDVDPPAIFADGPYSGRQPLPDGKGGAGAVPPDDFTRFRAIDRLTEKAWRIKLYGSKNVEGGALNEGLVAEVIGLRVLFANGLRAAMSSASAPIETLPFDQVKDLFAGIDTDLQKEIVDLVSQAAFGAPEYGGNPASAGWSLAHFEGDSQPLGYSLFDEAAGTYRERPEAPLSTKDPGPDPAPLDDDIRRLMSQVVAFTDGKVFP